VGHMGVPGLCTGSGGCWIELWVTWVYRDCALVVVVVESNCGSHECTGIVHW
jgi:hypothetical protein